MNKDKHDLLFVATEESYSIIIITEHNGWKIFGINDLGITISDGVFTLPVWCRYILIRSK